MYTDVFLTTEDLLKVLHEKYEIEDFDRHSLDRLIKAKVVDGPVSMDGRLKLYSYDTVKQMVLAYMLMNYVYGYGSDSKISNKLVYIACAKVFFQHFRKKEDEYFAELPKDNEGLAFGYRRDSTTSMSLAIDLVDKLTKIQKEIIDGTDEFLYYLCTSDYDGTDDTFPRIPIDAKADIDLVEVHRIIIAYVFFAKLIAVYREDYGFVGFNIGNVGAFKAFESTLKLNTVNKKKTNKKSSLKRFNSSINVKGDQYQWRVNFNEKIAILKAQNANGTYSFVIPSVDRQSLDGKEFTRLFNYLKPDEFSSVEEWLDSAYMKNPREFYNIVVKYFIQFLNEEKSFDKKKDIFYLFSKLMGWDSIINVEQCQNEQEFYDETNEFFNHVGKRMNRPLSFDTENLSKSIFNIGFIISQINDSQIDLNELRIFVELSYTYDYSRNGWLTGEYILPKLKSRGLDLTQFSVKDVRTAFEMIITYNVLK